MREYQDFKELSMRRVRLSFLPVSRLSSLMGGVALRQVEDWANKSTWYPVVIFGPEGCGRTALLR